MLLMILKLALATCIYIAVTVLLWHFWHKHKEHTLTQKLTSGLLYGLCSVISSHIGIDYGDMVLNVRDLGPLAAGLFFDPLPFPLGKPYLQLQVETQLAGREYNKAMPAQY